MVRIEPTSDIDAAPSATTFLELTDTPASYAGQGRKLPRVNQGATGLEFLAEIADLEAGNGFNVPRVVNNGGSLELQWFDLQQFVVDLTGAANRQIEPGVLVVPVPAISVQAVVASAPPGIAIAEPLTVPVPAIADATNAPAAATPETIAEPLTVPVPTIAVGTVVV